MKQRDQIKAAFDAEKQKLDTTSRRPSAVTAEKHSGRNFSLPDLCCIPQRCRSERIADGGIARDTFAVADIALETEVGKPAARFRRPQRKTELGDARVALKRGDIESTARARCNHVRLCVAVGHVLVGKARAHGRSGCQNAESWRGSSKEIARFGAAVRCCSDDRSGSESRVRVFLRLAQRNILTRAVFPRVRGRIGTYFRGPS